MGALSYVGGGQGSYAQETTYKYVGCGGDFDVVRPRRDFTCIITGCCVLSLLLLIPLLLWLLSMMGTTSLPFNCDEGFVNWQSLWSAEQQQYCCQTVGRGCTTVPSTAFPETPPPRPPVTQPPSCGASASCDACCTCDACGACKACRPVQLRRWFCKLGGWLVSGEEGVVLQNPWEGMPWSSWWLRNIRTLRLRCWFCQLGCRMVCGQEGVVLPAWRQRLPISHRWMCLDTGGCA